MSPLELVVVGDALLDRDIEGTVERLAPDAPVPVLDQRAMRSRPGGAGLAAALAAGAGHSVTFVTALGGDAAGRELAALLGYAGVRLIDLGLGGPTPQKIRLRAAERTMLRLDRESAVPATIGPLNASARAAIGWAKGILVADYGRGVCSQSGIRAALGEQVARGVPLTWDPHLRGAPPVPGATLVTPNHLEAAHFATQIGGEGIAACAARAVWLRDHWRALAVCVTRGAKGAVIADERQEPLAVDAPAAGDGDVCGAGDAFAARAAALLADGVPVRRAACEAVHAASTFVRDGGASRIGQSRAEPARSHGGRASHQAAIGQRAPREASVGGRAPHEAAVVRARSGIAEGLDQALQTIAATRARGGRVVATGGCFDLLHAGHLHTLQAARSLGDCLIVCLNGDESVRRLKGSARPLVPATERAALLAALECVDAVVVFEQDTPEALLERLRPDVWAKGGDYAGALLPESRTLEQWGARCVVLPQLDGRSTTRLLEEAATRVAI